MELRMEARENTEDGRWSVERERLLLPDWRKGFGGRPYQIVLNFRLSK